MKEYFELVIEFPELIEDYEYHNKFAVLYLKLHRNDPGEYNRRLKETKEYCIAFLLSYVYRYVIEEYPKAKDFSIESFTSTYECTDWKKALKTKRLAYFFALAHINNRLPRFKKKRTKKDLERLAVEFGIEPGRFDGYYFEAKSPKRFDPNQKEETLPIVKKLPFRD